MFDIFIAELRCPNCSTVSSTTAHTNMQTYIRSDPDSSALGIGFEFDPRELTTQSILNANYALIAEPPPGGPIRLLNIWICPACQTEQWGMVTITGGRIQEIEAVALNRTTFETANFITDFDADLLARRFQDPLTESNVEVLRKHLT
jgi:hypothetical protein